MLLRETFAGLQRSRTDNGVIFTDEYGRLRCAFYGFISVLRLYSNSSVPSSSHFHVRENFFFLCRFHGAAFRFRRSNTLDAQSPFRTGLPLFVFSPAPHVYHFFFFVFLLRVVVIYNTRTQYIIRVYGYPPRPIPYKRT